MGWIDSSNGQFDLHASYFDQLLESNLLSNELNIPYTHGSIYQHY